MVCAVHTQNEADEETYLRRILVDQKQESIAASKAMALEFPSAINQLCLDFSFERQPSQDVAVERVPCIVPLAAWREDAKV